MVKLLLTEEFLFSLLLGLSFFSFDYIASNFKLFAARFFPVEDLVPIHSVEVFILGVHSLVVSFIAAFIAFDSVLLLSSFGLFFPLLLQMSKRVLVVLVVVHFLRFRVEVSTDKLLVLVIVLVVLSFSLHFFPDFDFFDSGFSFLVPLVQHLLSLQLRKAFKVLLIFRVTVQLGVVVIIYFRAVNRD